MFLTIKFDPHFHTKLKQEFISSAQKVLLYTWHFQLPPKKIEKNIYDNFHKILLNLWHFDLIFFFLLKILLHNREFNFRVEEVLVWRTFALLENLMFNEKILLVLFGVVNQRFFDIVENYCKISLKVFQSEKQSKISRLPKKNFKNLQQKQ